MGLKKCLVLKEEILHEKKKQEMQIKQKQINSIGW